MQIAHVVEKMNTSPTILEFFHDQGSFFCRELAMSLQLRTYPTRLDRIEVVFVILETRFDIFWSRYSLNRLNLY